MNDLISKNDIDRVGLSEKSRLVLDELVDDGFFKDALSAYRLATSLSVFKKLDVSSHEVIRPSGHMYLISQLDPDGVLATVVSELFPNYQNQKYRLIERFADLGILMLQEEIKSHGSLVFWEGTVEG